MRGRFTSSAVERTAHVRKRIASLFMDSSPMLEPCWTVCKAIHCLWSGEGFRDGKLMELHEFGGSRSLQLRAVRLVYNKLIALKVDSTKTDSSQKLLVDRVAASRYINKSARLRDLLVYLCDRVLEGLAEEIHEQEIGHKVFG